MTFHAFARDAATSALVHVDDVALVAAQATIEFSGIAAAYTSLLVVGHLRTDRAAPEDGVRLQVGEGSIDTSAVYSYRVHERDIGSADFSDEALGDTSFRVSRFCTAGDTAPAGLYGSFVAQILNPSQAGAVGIVADAMYRGTNSRVGQCNGHYGGADVVNIIRFTPHLGSNFVAGSQLTIYGRRDQ